jgi:multidrug efflux system outer membrane protein
MIRPTVRSIGRLTPAAVLLLAGCAVGPDYHKPDVPTAAAYSEPGPWKVAQPKDALPKASWWKIFHDPALDALEVEATAASPTLRAALARFDAALAAAQINRAALLPNLAVNPSASRERYSGHRETQTPSTRFAYTTNSFDLPLDLTYEIDVFGEARRALESARDAAAAQGALYENVLLTLQAGVAQNYYTLRSLRSQLDLLHRNVTLLADTLELVKKLRAGGANSDLDLYQAESQLEITQSSELATRQTLAEQQHALAVLLGRNPEGFSLDPGPLDFDPPDIPVGLPSELLERRPDVAAAERSLASYNAQIGVAKAAFFPAIGLTAFAGYNSNDLNSLFKWGSREWGIGPDVSIPIFRGGALMAGYRVAKANYDAALAGYRGQVLVAFQQVEDSLSDLRYLALQAEVLTRATSAAENATRISTLRYKSGLVSYLEVIDAERTQLQTELALTSARTQRLQSTVLLVKALGGGWDTTTPPAPASSPAPAH